MLPDHPDDDLTRTRIVVAPGTAVGHYRIVDRIGAGGMGEVYLAEDTKLVRRVALKFLPVHLVQDADLRARFTREAQAAAKLDHPNIVTVYDVGEFEGRPYFAMQYVEGQTLHHYCHQDPLPFPKIIAVIAQVAEGLARAHAAGIVHRDIKSSNVVVDKDFRARILDFGLATVRDGDMLTRAGSTLGTAAYMSPEQAQGLEVDHRSDLFSLGVVLYELIAGRTPFKRATDGASLHAIISESPEPLARFKADVPPELQRITSKCLSKSVTERYQTAADLQADLRTLERQISGYSGESSERVVTQKPSLAVLPFANMSNDPENEFFSDGLTEELLNVLAKNPELKVTGRTSSFAFKGKQEDLRQIGQKLGVGTLLEGSVRKAGNRVRITAQLVNAADGFHLWSETYDRVLDDIFAVQDEIARAVSKALHVTLVGVSDKKVNAESYALALRAHHSYLHFNQESLALAVELYKRAIELDTTNTRAWAGLSMVYATRIAYGHAERETEYPLARHAAEKALALDDQSPEAHQAVAIVMVALELKIRESVAHIRKAYALAPGNCVILMSMALWEMVLGDYDQAIAFGRKAVDIDPLNPSALRELGRVLLFAGRIDEARTVMHRALTMSPDMTTVHMGLGMAWLFEGKPVEALAEIEKEKINGYRFCGLAAVEHARGRTEESDRYLASLIAEGEQWSFQIALVHGFRGENDQAFQWLDKALEIYDAGIPMTGVNPLLRSLHTDPRWPVFLKKIGLLD